MTKLVPLGTGEATLKSTVVPVDWGETNDFKVSGTLIATPRNTGMRALATDQRSFTLTK